MGFSSGAHGGNEPKNTPPVASLFPILLFLPPHPASWAHLPNKLSAPRPSSQTLRPGGPKVRPYLQIVWDVEKEDLMSAVGRGDRVPCPPAFIPSSHPLPPQVDRARSSAGPEPASTGLPMRRPAPRGPQASCKRLASLQESGKMVGCVGKWE